MLGTTLRMYVLHILVIWTIHKSSQSYLTEQIMFEDINLDRTIDCLNNIVLESFRGNEDLITILTDKGFTNYNLQDFLLRRLQNNWQISISHGIQTYFGATRRNMEKIYWQSVIRIETYLFLFVVETLDSFLNLTNTLASLKFYNPEAKYVVYFDKILEDHRQIMRITLQALWNMKCWKSIIVIPSRVDKLEIYGLMRQRTNKKCNDIPSTVKKGICTEGILKSKNKLFNDVVNNNFKGCVLDFLVMKYPPFVLTETSGIESEMLLAIENAFNFNINKHVEEVVKDWGERFPNGSWHGKLKHVEEDGVLGIGNVQATAEMYEDFGISTGYITEKIVWVVPTAERKPYWTSIYNMFAPKIWFVNISIIIVGATLYCIFSKIGNMRTMSFDSGLFLAIQTFIGNTLGHQPRNILIRTVFLAFSIYAIIIESIYESFLINSLTSPLYEQQISTEEEILSSKLGIGGIDVYKNIFNVTIDERAMDIFNRYTTIDDQYDTLNYWLKLVSDYRNTCTVAGQIYVRHLLSQNDPLVIEQGRPKISILNKIVISYRSRIVLPKGHYFLSRLDDLLNAFRDHGFVNKWEDTYSHKIEHLPLLQRKALEEPVAMELSLTHLQGAFCFLFFGVFCGVIAFVLEIIWVKLGLLLKANFKK